MNGSVDTIAAVATPPGRGGVGIIRISGPACAAVAAGLFGALPAPRHAAFKHFRDGDDRLIDSGLALYFPGPNSFTGEDVLELQGHGGPVVLDLLLKRCLALGARPARPGEFTERAFLNDKLDLAQAEAVADLIEAGSEAAARAAQQSLQGAFSAQVHALVEGLIELRLYVESAIDFPEEEIDFLSDGVVAERLHGVVGQLLAVQAAARQGCLLRDGMTVVIAGRPNAGKSSLMNALAGSERAIVTDIAGTTRDVLREDVQIDGLPLHLIDTAGLREGADVVEAEGIRRAWRAIEAADRLLLVIDDNAGLTEEDEWIRRELPAGLPTSVIRNKIDLSGRPAGLSETPHGSEIALSARDGSGLDSLRGHLKDCMGFTLTDSGGFSARRRHLDALARADQALQRAGKQLQAGAGELVAEELGQAQQALAEITGAFTSDDLLGRIFSSFCIGK